MRNDLQWLELGIRGRVDNGLLCSLPNASVRVARALQKNRQDPFETSRHILPVNGMSPDEIIHEQLEDFQRMSKDREHVHAKHASDDEATRTEIGGRIVLIAGESIENAVDLIECLFAFGMIAMVELGHLE